MSDTLLLDVEAATELHQVMTAVAEELDGDRSAIRSSMAAAEELAGPSADDPDPWLRGLTELLRSEADDLARRLRMVIFGGPEINAGLLALDHVRAHFDVIDNRGGEAGDRDGIVSRADLEWAVEHLDVGTAAAAQWLLDHEDFFRTVETARNNDDYLAAGATEFEAGGDGDGKLSLADVDAYLTKLDTWATLIPYMATIDVAAKGGDHDAVMSREDFEAFLVDYDLPPDVRAAAEQVLDDGAFHDTGGGLVSWGTLLDVASFIPVVGDFIDGAMALYYLSQGRWSEAAMSGIGLLPVPGVSGASTRAGREAVEDIGTAGGQRFGRELSGTGVPSGGPMFSSGATVSNADALAGGTALPFVRETVDDVAGRAGVGLDGVRVQLLRTDDEIRYLDSHGAVGFASDETIFLGPSAFIDDETLVRTLGHERTHLYQQQVWADLDALDGLAQSRLRSEFEDAAYGIEATFWGHYQGVQP